MEKYQKYAEYKDSGVEWLKEIPNDWQLTKAKYLFQKVQRVPEPTAGIVTAFRDGVVTLRSNRRTEGFTNSIYEIGYQGVQVNDLLIHSMDGFAGAIGVSDSDGKCSPVCSVCIAWNEDGIDVHYYGYLTRQLAVTGYITSLAKGIRERSTEFRFREYADLYLPVPSKSEQEQITKFIHHETAQIDSLIAKQEKLIELLKEKRQAVISHVVTKGLNPNVAMKDSGVEWLGRVPEHWGIWKFSHIAPIITCGVASTPTYVDESEGMPFLSAQNIKNNKLSLHKFNHIPYELHEQLTRYRRPERGDILVTRVGAGIGEACIVDIDLEFSIYVSLTHIRVRPEIAHNKFIMYFFGTDYCKFLNFDGTVTGGGVGNLNVNNVVKYRIALPTIEEQKQITDYLDNYIEKQDQLIAKAQSAIQLMQERRTALISSAVTGKIDVRNWQYPNEATTELSQ